MVWCPVATGWLANHFKLICFYKEKMYRIKVPGKALQKRLLLSPQDNLHPDPLQLEPVENPELAG